MKQALKNLLGTVLGVATWLLIGGVLLCLTLALGLVAGAFWRAFLLGWQLIN